MKKVVIKNKKSFIITSIVSAIAIGSGVLAGLYLGQEFITPQTNYGSLNQNELEDDNEKLFQKYQNTDKGSYSKFKHYEMINIGLKQLSAEEYFQTTEIGEVNASGIIQTIYGTNIRYQDEYFNESISDSSLVHVAKRFYQKDEKVAVYTGNVNTSHTATWSSDNREELTLNDFEAKWGKTLSRGSIYIISSKTVLDGDVKFEDNKYKVTVELDPVKSVVRYVKQMSEMSGLSRNPEFSSVKLEVTLNSDLKLLNLNSTEVYDVWKFGKHTSTGTLNQTFYYGIEEKIPDLNTHCNYEKR